ncbi:MAG TPA: EthD domain-containing protein [Actinomycetota bacterium]
MHGRGTEVDAMYRVHIWLRKSDGMSAEEFGRYWLETHAAIARDGYANLRSYVVNLVTGAGRDQEVPYDGVAEMTWDSREEFVADMKSEAAAAGTEDMKNFTSAVGLLFVDQHVVK